MTEFIVEVSHNQIAVFLSSMAQPFNEWTEKHVSQGFAWRPGSVSFRTIVEAGPHLVHVEVSDHLGPVEPDTVRAIEVPFDTSIDGRIEVGSVAETAPFSLTCDKFLLRCEFQRPRGKVGERVLLTFARKDQPHFAIVRADAELSNSGIFLTKAEPA